MTLLSVADAKQRILEDAQAITDVEMVPLTTARGRYLARDISSSRQQPPFDASAMDGYAVRACDVERVPVDLEVIGSAPAGHRFDGEIGPGQAVRIFTGAPVPSGGDAIVIQEDTDPVSDTVVRIRASVQQGHYIRHAGLDFEAGEKVLRSGNRLDAGRLTVAAAMNHPDLPVTRRPHIAIIATGDELVSPGGHPSADQIISSNAYGVASIAEDDGATVEDLGIVADRRDAIEDTISAAMKSGADILVTLGGASVGDHDLVQDSLVARGMDLDFWRIAMRPGKPLMYGRLGHQYVLGFPGNPVSSLVCAHLFLRPLLASLRGQPEPDLERAALLGRDLPRNDRRQDYLRSRLESNEKGEYVALPFDVQDSSMTRTFADADCLVIRAPLAEPASAGDSCTIVLLREPVA